MPDLVERRDREGIEAFLRRDEFLHLYGLGDLDDAFFPDTTWWTLGDGSIEALVHTSVYWAPIPMTSPLTELSAPPSESVHSVLLGFFFGGSSAAVAWPPHDSSFEASQRTSPSSALLHRPLRQPSSQ